MENRPADQAAAGAHGDRHARVPEHDRCHAAIRRAIHPQQLPGRCDHQYLDAGARHLQHRDLRRRVPARRRDGGRPGADRRRHRGGLAGLPQPPKGAQVSGLKGASKAAGSKRPDDTAIPAELYGLRRGTVGLLTACCVLFALFTLVPIVWLIINSTKTQANIFGTFGFWFARPFEFFHTFANLFRDVDGDGTYTKWFENTVLYSLVGGVGATVLAALAGYGFARFRFTGMRLLFGFFVAGLLVPITLVAVPMYLVFAKEHLINSSWGMILPSMVTPVGLYLMRTYVSLSIPTELLDAARIDGAGELRIFFRVVLPLMVPALMTVLLLSVVGTWNNFILPLIIYSNTT